MKAIIKRDLGHAEFVHNHPKPQVRDGYILVKTMAVALNPIDWMKIDYFPAPGTLLGSDYSGIVEAVGAGASERFREGQRVFGYILGGDHLHPENGAFAEYILAKAEMQYHMPEDMSFEEATTLGLAIMTANMGLYLKLRLARVESDSGKGPVLIYGGSTSSGAMAVQMAARSGYQVISTCSPQNAALVRSLGAEHVFDYKDPECAALIRKVSKDQLKYVLDTVGTPASAEICANAMSAQGGDYVSLLPVEFPRSDVRARFMDATTSLGEYFEYGPNRMPVEIDPEAFAFAKAQVEVVEKALIAKEIRPHQIDLGQGGLQGVLSGLQRMREHKVSASKLVYKVDETP